jgi:polyisoprenoid-binding protein YceI
MLLAALALGSALLSADTVRATAPSTWTADPNHSSLVFKVKHLNGRVTGAFKQWTCTITADPEQLTAGSVVVEVQTASIDTDNEKRDGHLRSPDFFDVEKFPTMTFRSTKLELIGSDLTLTGDLTLHGVTKPVVLKGTYGGKIKGPGGKDRMGFEATGKIVRQDYGLTWNRMVEAVALVGDEVTIELAIEVVPEG